MESELLPIITAAIPMILAAILGKKAKTEKKKKDVEALERKSAEYALESKMRQIKRYNDRLADAVMDGNLTLNEVRTLLREGRLLID